jgi:hypothetical protein
MAIDFSKKNVPEDELLSLLGDGDWLLAMPKDLSDLRITVAWRQELIETTASWFVRWVINEQEVTINHNWDPSWDSSGHTETHNVGWRTLLARYNTLNEWLEQAYTGNSTASFMSGMGLFWDTYEKDVEELITDELIHEMKKQFCAPPGVDDDWFWDEVFEESDLVQIHLEHALRLLCGQMTTRDAWQKYEDSVRTQLVKEEARRVIESARRDKMHRQAREFWECHFPDLQGKRIERPEFKALDLESRLREALADADPEIVRAIAEIGLPGLFSNTVAEDMKALARQALED